MVDEGDSERSEEAPLAAVKTDEKGKKRAI
jgi:hypothetical protein